MSRRRPAADRPALDEPEPRLVIEVSLALAMIAVLLVVGWLVDRAG